MNIFQMVATMLAIVNPFACIPIFVAIVKDFSPHRQKIILLRESIFAGILALILLFVGKPFLQTIHIEQYAVNLSGGILILLVAIGMIFPSASESQSDKKENETTVKKEPFVVPIATPLLTGGGFFAVLMALLKDSTTDQVAIAILITWLIVIPVTVAATFIQKLIGQRGLHILVQIMGMLLLMLAIQIILGGVHDLVAKKAITLANLVN